MICIHLLPETTIKAAATAPMLARGIGFSEALMDRMFGDLNGKQLEDQKDTAAWPTASYTQSFQPSTQAGTQQDSTSVVLAHRRTAGPRYGPARTDQTGEEQKARFRTVWQPRRMNRRQRRIPLSIAWNADCCSHSWLSPTPEQSVGRPGLASR